MYRDGYLVRCTGATFDIPLLYFCVFGDGKMSMYSEKGGKLVGEISMAGRVNKVRVEKPHPGKLPHRFSVSSAEVIRVEGRRMRLGEAKVFEFAAPNNDLMKEWANTLHLWRRMNWKENVKFFDEANELPQLDQRATLLHQIKEHHEAKMRRSSGTSKFMKLRNPMKGLMNVQATPTMKKLRDRVASSRTRSSSCATTTTASTA
ncbi:hypothetical protein Poli38472_012992 [Pythium oligandrum]|uniref:PH domain-containing protein n=1 Tax=Pythium oligandrum TaxID=41045 RepID=A0A8K1CKK3_PYTOL|nr:hypothetical protein Poli38472_012992 [Pythium oligandrum]|eukprot:TMW64370.1 hypothetical protein Poli38472_012992 [Pythium oligandrum]